MIQSLVSHVLVWERKSESQCDVAPGCTN